MALFIGIDSGTQGTKAVVIDPGRGRVLFRARAPHRMIAGLPPGHAEQHPREWIAALDSVLKAVAAGIDRARVRAIGVSGQQHGLVALDGKGGVIRPAKLWCDTSTAPECSILTGALGGRAAVISKLGLPFLTGYTAPKILWMKRHEPGNFRRMRKVLLPHDYLNVHLTGEASMEFGDASGTALMDVRKRVWSGPAIDGGDPDLRGWLPPLSASDRPAGILRASLAKRYGFPAGVLVSAGGGDNMMGAIGTGNVEPGIVTASFGTSGTIYAYSARPVVDPRGEIAPFCSSTGGWLPLLCTMNVTAVTERVRTLFGLDHGGLDAAARSAQPGSAGLLLVPYFAGERTPDVPDGCGVLFGLDERSLCKEALARAAMEGVTLGMNYGLRRLAQLGVRAREIRMTGGGSRSPVWRQISADVFGVPVVGMREEEGAALGAAIQACWCAARSGGEPRADLADLTRRLVSIDERTRCRPNRAHAGRYRDLQALQDRLSAELRGLFSTRRRLLAGWTGRRRGS